MHGFSVKKCALAGVFCRVVPLTLLKLLIHGGFSASLGKRLVQGGSRPADQEQKHIEDEERDGDVVKESRLAEIRPELIGSPKEISSRQQDCLQDFRRRWPARELVDEVGKSDHGQRKCGKQAMSVRRKEPREGIPGEEHSNTGQRDYAQKHRQRATRQVKTSRHLPLSPLNRKEYTKSSGEAVAFASRKSAVGRVRPERVEWSVE